MAGLFLLLLAIVAIVWLNRSLTDFEAERLNLTVTGTKVLPGVPGWTEDWLVTTFLGDSMAKINDTLTAKIAPTNAAGASAPVFDVAYFATGYTITPAPDGLSAVLVATSAGTGFKLTAVAHSAHGASLSQTVDLPDVDVAVDDEAVALNLTVG